MSRSTADDMALGGGDDVGNRYLANSKDSTPQTMVPGEGEWDEYQRVMSRMSRSGMSRSGMSRSGMSRKEGREIV